MAELSDTEKKNRILQEQADYRWLLSSEQGRRIASDLLSFCGLLRPSFDGTELGTVFAEGRRSVGLALHQQLQAHAPDLLELMHRENNHA